MNKTEFLDILKKVNQLPYGRNSDRSDFRLVETENRGTCSTKHAFLKFKADENQGPEVELQLCIFKMNAVNNSKIASILKDNSLEYIPEAHCYLKIDDRNYDITFPNSDSLKVENDILESQTIQAEQIGDYKLDYHKNYLHQWLMENKKDMSFNEIWKIRETCIQRLASN